MKKYLSIALAGIVCVALMVLGFVFSPITLSDLQKETLMILLITCGVFVLYCFVVGEITRNNSQMDKIWSITPIIYTWIVAVKGSFNLRLVLIAILVTIWGIRLTANFAQKGAYSIKFWEGEEDYRWVILRENKYFKNKFVWALFDLFFISFYQNFLVLLITLPALVVMESTVAFGVWDILVFILVFGFIALETIADIQQMKFYNKRKELMKDGKKLAEIDPPYNKGFNTTGIWKYSRHPNYFSEQSIWVSLYLFVISSGLAVYGIFHWSIVGCTMLILLFLGSSTFSEGVSSKKYPAYEEYIRTTSRYIPWFKRK